MTDSNRCNSTINYSWHAYVCLFNQPWFMNTKYTQQLFQKCFIKYIALLHVWVISQSVQSLSRVWLFATPWIAARQASLSITNSRSLFKLMPIESVMPSSHLISVIPFSSCPQSFSASCREVEKIKNTKGLC